METSAISLLTQSCCCGSNKCCASLYHSIQKMALFFSLPRHVHYSWGQCLPCHSSRNEVWFVTEDVSIIDQTRGGVGSLSLFGLGVVFCACRFSGSRVLYPIQLNRIKLVEPTMLVFFFKFNVMILVALCAKRNESGSQN